MREQFGKRLKLARSRSGFSQDQLVERMNDAVSKNSISKYEKGIMMPNSKVLIDLSNALGVKTDFFFKESTVELPAVKFRKTTKLNATEIEKIKGHSVDQLERYLEVEHLLAVDTDFKNPVKDIRCESPEDAEEIALNLRKKWKLGLNPIPNVVEMLEDVGIKVLEVDAPESFDGLSTMVGKIPLIVLNRSYDSVRKRFTALHELGHIVLNIDLMNVVEKDEEKMCHAFANEMLLPSDKFKARVGENRSNISLNELVDIKEYYGISIAALFYKIQRLGILPSTRVRSFWQMRRKNEALLKESEPKYGEYMGKEETERFMQLVYRAASENIISISKAASLANLKLSEFRENYQAL